MKRLAPFCVMLALMVAGCTTTQARVSSQVSPKPPPGSTIVLVKPDVTLSLLTASGVMEPRDDWNQAVASNLSEQISRKLEGQSYRFIALDPATGTQGRASQLLRLNQAVGRSIVLYSYGVINLPTKRNGFDWTLGEGASAISPDAQFAMFVHASGAYSSSARIATAVGMSLLGVAVPLGQQQVMATLIDLKTGRVVWTNVAIAGPTADMRDREGAENLTDSLLKDLPILP